MQPSRSARRSSRRVLFQSSPARRGGCNWTTCVVYVSLSCFNPHPPVGAGATPEWSSPDYRHRRFNPHPPVGAGATLNASESKSAHGYVSILTRPWGRVQPPIATNCRARSGRMFQSSPARGGRCNSIVNLCAAFVCDRFNPHPPWGRVQRGLENARERFPKRKCSSCQGVPCRALGG